jgi:hypothetical protein
MPSVQYDGLDHAAVQMLVDHVDGSGVRADFEILPDGRALIYIGQVLLWPGCQVTRDDSNQVTVTQGTERPAE